MSLEVLLIPIGIAAFAAWRESRSTDLCEKCKTTRITDQGLLRQALDAIGATNLSESDGRITGRSSHGHITFQRVGEVFLGRVDKMDQTVTSVLLAEVEAAVGVITQTLSVNRIRQRASELGLNLIEETNDNGTIQFVFEQA